MSHLHYAPADVAKEPHPISLKVLRLARPSLVSQYPVVAPLSHALPPPIVPASLAYREGSGGHPAAETNTDAFLLSPILSLPPSFGSAYVGETFACTLCVNHDGTVPAEGGGDGGGGGGAAMAIRDVRIEAEMKMPSVVVAAATATAHITPARVVKLVLFPETEPEAGTEAKTTTAGDGVDLAAGQTLQKVVRFSLEEEGNYVLAVTVSYYEATETSGRTRTFRKLYQFICKPALIVRTKAGLYPFPAETASAADDGGRRRRWILEAQLENCGEDVLQLERVVLDLEPALAYEDCNDWGEAKEEEEGGDDDDDDNDDDNDDDDSSSSNDEIPLRQRQQQQLQQQQRRRRRRRWRQGGGRRRPVLHPGEVEQVSFLIEETAAGGGGVPDPADGRLIFGVLGIGWRGEMGNRGFLSTGKLGTRAVR